eukprot:6004316-Pyramimonas_sp.AAC.1
MFVLVVLSPSGHCLLSYPARGRNFGNVPERLVIEVDAAPSESSRLRGRGRGRRRRRLRRGRTVRVSG